MVDISVVVPVYKSEGGLAELYQQVSDALRGKRYELILVDDQSPDGSWESIKKLCEADPTVVGIRLRKNAGQDSALMAGLRQCAVHSRSSWMMICNIHLMIFHGCWKRVWRTSGMFVMRISSRSDMFGGSGWEAG